MESYFNIVIDEAKKAFKNKEVPVGAIIVKNGKVIAKAHNNRQKNANLIGHAEILCILKAEKKLKDWRLDGCTMYVSLEPCDMCKKMISEARIDEVFYLKPQNLIKNSEKKIKITQTNVCDNAKIEYDLLLKKFFAILRNKVKNK